MFVTLERCDFNVMKRAILKVEDDDGFNAEDEDDFENDNNMNGKGLNPDDKRCLRAIQSVSFVSSDFKLRVCAQ